MVPKHSFLILAITLLMSSLAEVGNAATQAAPERITILVDAFASQPEMHLDWGYAALVEYRGRRILFDTGNDAAGFAKNVERLGVEVDGLDAIVISHRHGDHTAALGDVLRRNPQAKVYVPDDEAFGGPTPSVFFKQTEPTLPAALRYFGGSIPEIIPHGSAWPDAAFIRVESTAEIAPGLRLVRNISSTRQFNETPELSLVIDTPKGQIVVVGCSHPGIEHIVASIAAKDPRISMIVGGLHLVTTPRADVQRLVLELHDKWKIARIAPGHCTGEHAFLILQRVFRTRYVYAGVGSVIDLS